MIKKIWNGPVTEFFGGIPLAEYYKEVNVEPTKTPTEKAKATYPSTNCYEFIDTSFLTNSGPQATVPSLEQLNGKDAATKHDLGKTDWSLLPWDAVEEVIKVLQFGAGKYSPWNWAENGGFKFNRLFNSSMRHFVAWFWHREDNDPETGLSHLSHMACNILFLLHYVLNGNKFKNNDNRPNVP